MTMTADQVLAELESMGTAQNRKVYARHGVGRKMFGVSYANLGKLKKKIKVDHDLAEALWASGYHDARVLATMVADGGRARSGRLDAWARNLDNYIVTDAFATFVGRTPFVQAKFEKWGRSKNERLGQVGWLLLSSLAQADGELEDAYFETQLETIEREIHDRKNRLRYAMNTAVITIGSRNAKLKKKAIAAAKRIGKVDVDHGETGCKTPDAAPYIEKIWARKAKKAAKKAG